MSKRVVVITGATSGIGRELTKAFSECCVVFAGYRNPYYERDLKKISSNIIPFFIDMEKESIIDGAALYIMQKTKKIDLLINVAGCVAAGPIENMPVKKLEKQFMINTFSHLRFTQKLFNLLEGGRVINISSMSSFGIFPFIAPYCASKRALDILFNSLEIECNHIIKVISVKPGVIATPLWHKSIELNKESLYADKKYENEMLFMANNAMKNEKKGLSVNRVSALVKKIAFTKNPKSSYTIGFDAKIAELVSKLPQDWINFLIDMGLKHKGLR